VPVSGDIILPSQIRRGQTFDNPIHSLDGLSRLAIALLNPGSGYVDMLTKPYQFQALG
jgi:hypothetical protein